MKNNRPFHYGFDDAVYLEKFLKQLRAEMRGMRNTPIHLTTFVTTNKRLDNWIKRISKEIDR